MADPVYDAIKQVAEATVQPDKLPFTYSGIVKETNDVLSRDWLWVYISRDHHDGETVQIQSNADIWPFKFELTMTLDQTEGLYRCLRNALKAVGRIKEP